MSNRKVRKYIESHWLIFALQGIVGLLFGWFVMFTNIDKVSTLVIIAGITLLVLGVIDLANLIYRKRRQQNWGLALILGILNFGIGLALLFTKDLNVAWALSLLAGYTIFCGVFEILLGFKSLSDPTDRFMWIVCGICACILGFVVLNSGHFENPTTFIKFFGTYTMIYGITALIYAVHNKNELAEEKEERRLARERRKKEAEKRNRNPLSRIFKSIKKK
ncbi:MAG: DUF308 domain-containing protein [Candidatus Saccharibacteria bacterium]|nr:DUF308 domain-containing protein [Candidatus Saccharibacteria bacterium]